MALRRKPVRYERVLAVSLGVRGSSIPTTTWGALVRTCRHRYGTGQKAYRDLLGGGSPLTPSLIDIDGEYRGGGVVEEVEENEGGSASVDQ